MNRGCHVLSQYPSDDRKSCLKTPPKEAEVIQEVCGEAVRISDE